MDAPSESVNGGKLEPEALDDHDDDPPPKSGLPAIFVLLGLVTYPIAVITMGVNDTFTMCQTRMSMKVEARAREVSCDDLTSLEKPGLYYINCPLSDSSFKDGGPRDFTDLTAFNDDLFSIRAVTIERSTEVYQCLENRKCPTEEEVRACFLTTQQTSLAIALSP